MKGAKPKISILGCGWLGLPLAETLAQEGFPVKGSTTSESKTPVLGRAGIVPFLISLSADGISGDISGFLSGSEILIIDIPPKLQGGNSENFTGKIKTLVPHIEKAGITKVIFTSSTAVYADDETNVTEETTANPTTDSGKQLLETEMLLLENPNFETTILRFGGLIGEDRHPVKYLAGKLNLENPDAPVNLIHRKDCIGIMLSIIRAGIRNDIFNAVAPYHPSRKDYYTQKATELQLPFPSFTTSGNPGKIIDSKKLISTFGYDFLKPGL